MDNLVNIYNISTTFTLHEAPPYTYHGDNTHVLILVISSNLIICGEFNTYVSFKNLTNDAYKNCLSIC